MFSHVQNLHGYHMMDKGVFGENTEAAYREARQARPLTSAASSTGIHVA